MTEIVNLKQIKEALKNIDPIHAVEEGFVTYSQGKVVVPPVGEMIFKRPPGEVHIKYGYITGDEYYVIKIASGFEENIKHNLPTCLGLMLVFKQKTGELACSFSMKVISPTSELLRREQWLPNTSPRRMYGG